MKRNLLVLAALIIVSAGFGQVRPRHSNHHGPSMKEALSLDSAQFATIKGINRKYSERAKVLRHDTVRTVDAKRKDWQQLQEQRTRDINSVLTPVQQSKLEDFKKQRVEHRQAAKAEAKARRDGRIKSQLSLTDEQLAKMKSARKKSFDQARKDYETEMKKILTKEQFEEWKKMNEGKRERKSKGK
jgi:Spy/CpxP family protein refolding chaperone